MSYLMINAILFSLVLAAVGIAVLISAVEEWVHDRDIKQATLLAILSCLLIQPLLYMCSIT